MMNAFFRSEVNKVSHKWWSSLQTAGRADSAAKFETFLVSLIYTEVIREESTKLQPSTTFEVTIYILKR